MANKLCIKEFESMPLIGSRAPDIWAEPGGVEQTPLAITGTSATSSAFGARTKYICITSDINVSYLVSTAGTAATVANFPLWANQYIAFAVTPGDKISGILWS